MNLISFTRLRQLLSEVNVLLQKDDLTKEQREEIQYILDQLLDLIN